MIERHAIGSKGPRRGPFLHVSIALFGLAAFISFIALGNWQVERRAWKLDLIERVGQRVHASPVSAPAPEQWPAVNRADDEYRRVSVRGSFVPGGEFKVAAATELGSGYWVLTALRRVDGSLVFINRGYVGQGVTPLAPANGTVVVTGLLRLNEPGGGVLRDNVPDEGRWYSRDVRAMAVEAGLGKVAPYFIDAGEGEPGSPGGDGPTGGLTVISFKNTHLIYAVTWYGLAAMLVAAALIAWRHRPL